MTTTKKWYAVYTRPRWEKKVTHSLTTKKIESYCPLNMVQKQWSDRKKIILEPLFNSYVFVFAESKEFTAIKQSDGVINFVHWLGNPAVIREEEIDAIRNFLLEYKNVKLEKGDVNISAHVRIASGPLMDVQGKVIEIGQKTVKVYLPTLGYQMVARIEKSNIELLKGNAVTHTLAS